MTRKERRRNRRTIIICVVIAILVICTAGISAFAANGSPPAQGRAVRETDTGTQDTAAMGGKDEIVYANLAPGGSVEAVYTVNHFTVTEGSEVTDYGAYESVVNLTNTDPVNLRGDTVSFQANTDNFYYQGNMTTTDLPWNFDISYFLDGAQMQPQDLAGKSGKLEIRIKSSQNDAVDSTFYDNYMMQISVTLDTEKCSNIDAPEGTAASAGKDTVIAYTVLPGNDADFALTADVREFEMTGVSITGMPYSMSMEFPDTDESLGDLEKLPEAISELNDGVGELASGTQDMESGAASLVNGSAGIKSGLDLLSANGGKLKSGSAQIGSALSQIAAALNASGLDDLDLSMLTELPAGLTQLSDGLKALSGGLSMLKDNFTPAYAALDSAIQGIPQGTLTEVEIMALIGKQTDPADAAVIGQLAANYEAAQTVKGTYGAVKPAFDAVGTAIDQTTGGLGQMTSELDASIAQIEAAMAGMGDISQLSQLVAGINALATNYAEFNAGLVGYTDGVSTLAANYGAFHSGLVAFSGGVDQLNEGVSELYDGTETMNDEIADLPDMIQEEIDKMKADYLPAVFDPVSFTSPKNTDTEFVQFILQCDAIQVPDAPEEAEAEEEPETFWDRLKALFQSGD